MTDSASPVSRSQHPLPFGKDVEVFFDGECPLCRREIDWLKRRDRLKRIQFTDLHAPGFKPAALGLTESQLMSRIHGRLPDGTIIRGVEVFRQLYSAIGFRWAAACSRLPLIRQVLDVGYLLFAKNRLRITGRCTESSCSRHGEEGEKRSEERGEGAG